MCPRRDESERVSIDLVVVAVVVAHALNGTIATELALKVLDFGVVAETRDEKCLQWVADNIGVLMGLD